MALRIRLFQSSSTKLAVLFSSLLTSALFLLTVEVYRVMAGGPTHKPYTIAILSLMGITSLGLFIISFYVTKRINTIADTVDTILTTRDLSQRIPVASHWDDLSKLSDILNLMLADIEQLVATVKQVSDNIAHDLRTPLARMRNRIESMRASGTNQIDREDLSKLSHECDGLLATFNGLLRIAKIEASHHNIEFSKVNLGHIVQDVVELYEPLASEKSIHFSYRAEPVTIMGDKDMLFQAFANLIDNAIKYTPEGGVVVVTLDPSAGGAHLTFTDSGMGIPDVHKPQVFSRFYRVDSCRNQPGLGLGLSLVQAIIALHRGQIALKDHAPTGLIVTIDL
jgi:signal transduction histidine kinase